MDAYGWDKVLSATACYALDGAAMYDEGDDLRAGVEAHREAGFAGRVTDEHVFVATTRGDVWVRAIKRGEHAADVAAHYRKRGRTDAALVLFTPKA